MIRVLAVDDDFMVAKVHSRFVERTPGFAVVGVAHTGAEAAGGQRCRRRHRRLAEMDDAVPSPTPAGDPPARSPGIDQLGQPYDALVPDLYELSPLRVE